MRGRFIEEEDFRTSIARAREDDALALSARERLPMSPIRLL
jgi:hypothetical protein